MNRLFGFLLFMLGLAFTGCFTERVSNQNMAYLYDGDKPILDPQFVVGHLNDSMSYIDFRINSNELLYLQNARSGYFSSEFRLRYEVLSDLASVAILDSTVVLYKDSAQQKESKFISGRINLKPSTRKISMLKIDLRDNNRGLMVQKFIELDRRNHNCRQFFTVRKSDSDFTLDGDKLSDGQYLISHNLGQYSNATVKYYDREFPIAPPPFSVEPDKVFDLTADSTFQIQLGQPVSFDTDGFYHIQVVDSVNQGVSLFRFNPDFPFVKKLDHMIAPLRILNSKNEFKKIKEAEDQKVAIDRFWLKIAGERRRAKDLIAKFYSRVQDANSYFTSHVDGWKTDRGLVYLVYGPPNTLYKNSQSEIWIYGEEGHVSSLNLSFLKMRNPFTDNDYKLDRSPIYKNSWYQAVDSWRQGRIYTDN
ncbi:MAG: GWxTD domain-containing protein [Flavobacteriales bacterium]|jgi:GWxTD domain-containing protein